VLAFTPEQLATFMRIELSEICHRINSGELHLTGVGRTFALVCGNSLHNGKQVDPTEKRQS
jgi:hypothetical protein